MFLTPPTPRCATAVWSLVVLAWLAALSAPASAQLDPRVVDPILPGRTELPPEIPPPVIESQPLPLGTRTLPRIQIPEDDPSASALSGGSISVRAFRFRGNSVHTDEALEVVTRDYIGEGRRYSALLEARDRVTRLYVDSGYISSGAVLPRQDFSDGVIELEIVEGKLTQIEYETDGRLRQRYFTSRLDTGDQSLNVNDLRERLRRLKRDPRVEAITAELFPGDQRGESVLSIVVAEQTPYWTAASFDNDTSESVGGLRGYFRAGHRNLSGWGDTLSVAYGVAEGLNDLDVRLEAPVTRWDTEVEFSLRRAWSEIVEDVIADRFDIENKTEAYGVRVEQPVLRRRGEEARVFFGAEWKRGRSYLDGERGFGNDPNRGKTTVTVLRTGADYLLRLRRRAFAGRITANVGIDALGATPATRPDQGDAPDGKFVTGLIQLQEVEYLPWYGLRIQSRLDAQIADDAIPALEQFALGGDASVRGFRENLAVRDQGVVGSVELRVPLPVVDPIENLELGVFTDAGYGRYLDSAAGNQPVSIVGVGLGLHADITRYVRTSIEWAFDAKAPSEKSGVVAGNELQDDGLYFSLQVRFP